MNKEKLEAWIEIEGKIFATRPDEPYSEYEHAYYRAGARSMIPLVLLLSDALKEISKYRHFMLRNSLTKELTEASCHGYAFQALADADEMIGGDNV